MPTVSVITPFLNAEPYLAAAIESVRRQSETNWELLLIDDGSTDKSVAIARRAAELDPRLRLVFNSGEQRGAAAARNLGLRSARGEFVSFLDADDLYEPDALANAVAALKDNPKAGMVYGPSRWWHPGNNEQDWTESVAGLTQSLHHPPDLLIHVILLQRGHVPCTCGVLIRREVIDTVGGFEEQFRLYEDQTLWVKVFLSSPVSVIDTCMARYRQHPESVSALAMESGEYDRLQPHTARAAFLQWLSSYVDDCRQDDPRIRRAMRIARASYDAPPGLQRTLDRLSLFADRILCDARDVFKGRITRLLRCEF
ncbi:glycosyltransferase [Microvirga terrae]|uniref:Glycosyltransferase n=1 Tax=Microvirga terrae TaxID=2740529 RepID=A0ABY5RMG7_9HYPH|nr:glycosyltransferase [Microvirga terrae]UVF18430.1 glycosyltransferase [Microvirga terrae]